ncbi:hypothetical protein B9Z55_025214 [Caenorhabditis nigoni]|uniref:EGF-like domain-containing protein n=1 Tax=Caenorhabditis nigoni TaxID=1611254 RepID=A0A2G5SXW5_9PELO|nr:hypothetical protein B9Z55_025214 [Caenorhabditis nigoni]
MLIWNFCVLKYILKKSFPLSEGSPCDSHPCWNEGKCILNGSSSYHCECPPAFIGPQCEYRLFEICRSIRCRSSTSPICQVGSFFANCSFVNQQGTCETGDTTDQNSMNE